MIFCVLASLRSYYLWQQSKDFVAGFGDEDGVLPLGGGFVVFGAHGPAVVGIDDPFAHASSAW